MRNPDINLVSLVGWLLGLFCLSVPLIALYNSSSTPITNMIASRLAILSLAGISFIIFALSKQMKTLQLAQAIALSLPGLFLLFLASENYKNLNKAATEDENRIKREEQEMMKHPSQYTVYSKDRSGRMTPLRQATAADVVTEVKDRRAERKQMRFFSVILPGVIGCIFIGVGYHKVAQHLKLRKKVSS